MSETAEGLRPAWRRALPTLTVAGVGVVVAVLGFAAAGSGSPPTLAPVAGASASPGHGGWGRPWGADKGWGPAGAFDVTQALHGEVVVAKDGGTQTLLIQKGSATAVSGTSITVRSTDGYTRSYRVTGDTRTAGSVAANADVVVIAVKDGDGGTAQAIVDPGRFGRPSPARS